MYSRYYRNTQGKDVEILSTVASTGYEKLEIVLQYCEGFLLDHKRERQVVWSKGTKARRGRRLHTRRSREPHVSLPVVAPAVLALALMGAFVGSEAAWRCFESPKRVKRSCGKTHQAGNSRTLIGLCMVKLVDPEQKTGTGGAFGAFGAALELKLCTPGVSKSTPEADFRLKARWQASSDELRRGERMPRYVRTNAVWSRSRPSQSWHTGQRAE